MIAAAAFGGCTVPGRTGVTTIADRAAQERLADWRAAERAEGETPEGSVERRRAVATTRRARWAFEDAARDAADDHGAPEPLDRMAHRTMTRMSEAASNAANLNTASAAPPLETDRDREERIADEAEIQRELGDG